MIPVPNFAALIISLFLVLISWISTIVLIFLWLFKAKFLFFWSWTKSNPNKFLFLILILVLFDCFGIYMSRLKSNVEKEVYKKYENKKSRRNFTLQNEYQFGDVLFPAGTKIVRYDPNDNGEDNLPLSLTGLDRAEFPYPLKINNLMVTAIQRNGDMWLLWLDGKHQIQETWCDENQVAAFAYPYISGYEVIFKTSEWIFKYCLNKSEVSITKPSY